MARRALRRSLPAAGARVALGLLGLLLQGCAAGPPPRVLADGRVAMGTALDVRVVTRDPALGRRVLDAVFEEIDALDALVSHYDPRSEVSQLSRAAGSGPVPVDPRLLDLVRRSLELGALTQGAFDVTVGPLVAVWREAGDGVPAYERIAEARARSGQDGLRLAAGGRVELVHPGMRLDFGGIAKGWALERVRPLLRSPGIEGALASFGQSSVLALGSPPPDPASTLGGQPSGWTLALRSPAGGLAAKVTLRDLALSVSSSFPEPRSADATRDAGMPRTSIVDPRTGWPVEESVMAAVVARDATQAEALSTALCVLGPERGLALIASLPEVEAMLVDGQGRIAVSSGWQARTQYREVGNGFRALSPSAR